MTVLTMFDNACRPPRPCSYGIFFVKPLRLSRPLRPHFFDTLFCFAGGWKHDVRSVQLQHSAEPGLRLPARGAVLCGPEGGSGAAGEEVPGHGRPGTFSTDRTYENQAGEEVQEQSLRTNQNPAIN